MARRGSGWREERRRGRHAAGHQTQPPAAEHNAQASPTCAATVTSLEPFGFPEWAPGFHRGGRPPWPEQRGHALPPRQAPRACLGASQTRLWREDTRARGSPQGSQWQRAWGRVPGPRATAQDRSVPRAGSLRPPFPPGPPYPQHVRPLTLYFLGCCVSSVCARLPRVRRMDTSSSGAHLRGSWVRRERSRIPAPLGGSAHGLGAGSAGAFRRSRRADMPSRALSRRRAPTRSCSARLAH